MKVILNEQQFQSYIQTEKAAQLLQESFRQNKSLENLKRKVKYLLATGVAVASVIAAINKTSIPQQDKAELISTAQEVTKGEPIQQPAAMDYTEQLSKIDSIRQQKVDACREYMEYALKNQGFSLESTELKPETLVQAAEETDFDLPFLMAVAHQESCFGATSRAQKSGSVFSVGAYDNGKDVVHYDDPNDSVMGYIELLHNDYSLGDEKNIQDLMTPGQFVNMNGHRYASDKGYEQKISNIRRRIIRMHPELSI